MLKVRHKYLKEGLISELQLVANIIIFQHTPIHIKVTGVKIITINSMQENFIITIYLDYLLHCEDS
jgi:hypothetical protein